MPDGKALESRGGLVLHRHVGDFVREGLARYSTEAETAFALQGLGAHPILAAGRAEVVDHWIPRVSAGEAVAAFALTEPDAGSDVAAIALAAEPDGAGFRLSGDKVFISNAPDADIYTVFARTTAGAEAGSPGSPVPLGAAVLGTMCTSTAGISSMRSSSKSWKFDCSTAPFLMVIASFSAAERP